MNYDEFLYQAHYMQYMTARRFIKHAEREIRYSRVAAVVFGCFGLAYVLLLLGPQFESWWYIIFIVVFLAVSGLHAWMGWWFYPENKQFWERALAEHQKELESLAPNVKENPEAA